MSKFDVAIVGAGPAGIMAAITAAKSLPDVALIERNDSIGKKLLITGGGRCNLTNNCEISELLSKFSGKRNFLKPAVYGFTNGDLKKMFESKGLRFSSEGNACVFPANGTAVEIVKILEQYLLQSGVKVLFSRRVKNIKLSAGSFELIAENSGNMSADKIILATGGVSYKNTGSSGDGFKFAENLGHKIAPLTAGLAPLKIKENWVKQAQGISLKQVAATAFGNNKKIISLSGEILFTHFGVSGPLVLDLSNLLAGFLNKGKEVRLEIDFIPEVKLKQLEELILNKSLSKGSAKLKSVVEEFIPKRLALGLLLANRIDPGKKMNQVTKNERRELVKILKSSRLAVAGALPIDAAMITNGGVVTEEINSRTMESKIVPGLYFAGEIIDTSAPTGGFNLQQAFSTGHLAGKSAAEKWKKGDVPPN